MQSNYLFEKQFNFAQKPLYLKVFFALSSILVVLFFVIVTAFPTALERLYPRPRSSAAGLVFYVSTAGSDSNTGSIASPFRTIAKGVSALSAGDTLYIRSGIYSERVVVTQSGTTNARITVAGYPGETAIIDGDKVNTGLNGGLVWADDGADYVTFKNLTVQNGQGRGIQINSNYGEVIGNKIHNFQHSGINTRDKIGVLIRDNEIYDTAKYRYEGGNAWPAAMSSGNGTNESGSNTKFINNYSHDNFGEGLGCYVRGCYVGYNTMSNNTAGAIYILGDGNTIENNFVIESVGASGMGTNEEKQPVWNRGHIFRNNLIVNVDRSAFKFFNYIGGDSGLHDMTIENNTFVNTGEDMIKIANGAHRNTVFRNNILYTTRQKNLITIADVNDTVFNNNVLFDSRGSSAQVISWNGNTTSFTSWIQSGSNVWGDPQFVNTSGSNPDDFRLKSSSPFINQNYGFQGSVGADLSHPSGLTPTPTPSLIPLGFTPTPTPASSTSVIQNGGFTNGSNDWTFYTDGTGEFTVATPGMSGDAGHITVANAGTNTQLYQTGITLSAATRYTLSFDALSSSNGSIDVNIHKHTSPYSNYGLSHYQPSLSASWQHYETTFSTSGFTGSTNDARLRITFLSSGDFAFDNVSLMIESGSISPTPTTTPTPTTISLTPTPTATPIPFSADINLDGIVNVFDLGILAANYGATIDSNSSDLVKRCDINNDSVVNIFDLGILVGQYQQ
ncbi:hypothetical protein HGA91_03470 [candidate division WWE3 bacterium]|nr:hypothetical protein [candidate division WWE3 bacterium]